MRRQNDEQLRCWAHEISQRLMQDGWPAAYLIYHGSPGSEGPSSAHAENTENIHILAMQDIGVGDLRRLQQLLQEEGVGDVTVKQANSGGSRAASIDVPQPGAKRSYSPKQ